MQVLGRVKNESKEPLIDSVTHKTIRHISKNKIKCQFYNSLSNKFSEILIPEECLVEVKPVKEDVRKMLLEDIDNERLVNLKTDKYDKIGQVLALHAMSGHFSIDFLDYSSQKEISIELNGVNIVTDVVELGKTYPLFEIGKDDKFQIISIYDVLKSIKTTVKLLIVHKKESGQISKRIIHPIGLHNTSDNEEIIYEKVYLEANCELRDAKRFFRLDRILFVNFIQY